MESLRKGKVRGNEEGEEEGEHEILKKRISGHPLYRLLVESHIDCLKVSGTRQLEIINDGRHFRQLEDIDNPSSELDHFMEAYCFALGKLKEAIEEPQQKSMAFINNMQSQLTELASSINPSEPDPTTSDVTGECIDGS